MSNGGYKGASPARETSPEQYPGVWELTEQFQAQADGNWPFQAADCAPKSLRFDGSSSYLSKTPTQAGNKRTWTFSFWVKRCNVGNATQVIWMAYNGAIDEANYATISFTGTGQLRVGWAYDTYKTTTAQYRDPSAWMHCCISVDTNHAVASERVQIAINGVKQTEFAGSHDPDLGQQLAWNGAYLHHLGSEASQQYSHNYLSEIQFVDGQQLSCEEFGFFNGQGIWMPKRFTGNFADSKNYSGRWQLDSGSSWISGPEKSFDGILGNNTQMVRINGGATWTAAESIPFTTLRIYGFDAGSGSILVNGTDVSSQVEDGTSGWGWNTITGITSPLQTIRITGTTSITTGIGGIEIDGNLLLDATVGRNSFKLDFSDTSSNAALGKDSSGVGNDWTPHNLLAAGLSMNQSQTWSTYGSASSGGFSLAAQRGFNGDTSNQTEGDTTGAYFSIPFSATIASGDVGFQAYSSGGSGHMKLYNGSTEVDDVTSSGNTQFRYSTYAGQITEIRISRDNRAFEFGAVSVFGQILVDAGLPDPTLANIDSFVDSPVNGNEASTGAGGQRRGNYCILTPLDALATTLSNGNLAATGNTSTAGVTGSIGVSSGKWYFEMTAGSDKDIAGIWPTSKSISGFPGSTADSYGYFGSGVSLWSGSGYTYGDAFAAGDIIGVALDLDNGTLVFYKNNVSQGTAFTGLVGGFRPAIRAGRDDTASTAIVNFGQRGFSYGPPTGFSPLATSFLPEPSELAKNPSKAFDILLWSGDGVISDRTISGIDMESGPDMVWSKTRNHAYHNNIFDSVRGFGNSGGVPLTTDYKDSQASGGVIKSTDSTSITWEKASNNAYVWYNESGKNYVSWLWDAGTATTSISAGGSNNLAYDQSQTWSNSLSASFRSGEPATNAFDGDTSTIAGSAGSITYTSPVAVASSSTIRVIVHGGDHNVSVNGGGNQTVAAGSFVTLNFTNPTNNTFTIAFDRVSAGADTGVRAIEIGGKLLVDNGVSVTNVPGAACDVRANPEAGFSIVKVDSPNSTEARAHGLSKAPDFIIAKATASGNTQHYHMFHSHFGKSHYAVFNGDAWTSSDQWGSQEPNTHSFYVKTNTGSGANFSGGMIYYIWHAVENYSAMGSYVGNGVSNGPMIYLGWEPKWLMIKGTGSSTEWRIYDATREPFNVKTLTLHASNANTETHFAADDLDFLSNGFKIRSTGSFHNTQDATYLYVAFAANPFALNTRAH